MRDLDAERKESVEERVSAFLSRMSGKQVAVRMTRIGPGARRTSKLAREWFAFDAHLDAEITIDGVTTRLDRYSDQIIPDVALGKRPDLAPLVPMVVPLASEILLASNVIINVTVPAAVAAALAAQMPRPDLSAREVQVLELIVRGLANKQIAYSLNIAEHTVKNHVKSILGKLGAQDRTQAATVAIQRGIIHI